MNFENIFILPNVIGDRSRRRFGGIFIKIPKVTSVRSSLFHTLQKRVRRKVKPSQLRLKWGGWPAPSLLIQ